MASATLPFSLSKPRMKPPFTNMPTRLILWIALRDVAPRVLLLLHGDQRLVIGALDADEEREEIGVAHQRQQLVVVREVDRGLGGELERKAVRLLPGR